MQFEAGHSRKEKRPSSQSMDEGLKVIESKKLPAAQVHSGTKTLSPFRANPASDSLTEAAR